MSKTKPKHTKISAHTLQVLIVDNEPDDLEILKKAFQADGWRAYVAQDAAHALRIMRGEKFDAILTEIDLPKMGGIEFIGHAKVDKLNKNTKFFIISTKIDDENLDRISRIGVASTILKPFDPKDVLIQLNYLPLKEEDSAV